MILFVLVVRSPDKSKPKFLNSKGVAELKYEL
jgi:hypothetical protein